MSPCRAPKLVHQVRNSVGPLIKLITLVGLLLTGRQVHAQSGADVLTSPARQRAAAKPGVPPTPGTGANRGVLAAPVAYARTSQILLNTYADTQLAVPLLATDADPGDVITSYTVTTLPPATAGVLKINGTTVVTTKTVIAAADAGNLTFDPAAGYFGTAVFQYRAKDNTNTLSAIVTYGIPVSKATCGTGEGQANLLNYYARTEGEDWKVSRTVVVGGVTITSSPTGAPYTSSPATTDILFVSDQPSMPGKGLVWAEDYTSTAATTSSVTFTFSRPLANFSLSMGDIDNGTGYIDQVMLQGYDASNNLVTIPAANVSTGTTNSYAANVFTGTANSPANANANVLASFPAAISRLVMTYRNTATTQADPASQLIVFPSMAWCAQADVQTTLTGPGRAQAASTVTLTATTQNVSGDAVNTIQPTVQLPTGLSGVTGGTYVSSTGVLTLPAISNLAAGASVAQAITYTMPATVAVTATSSFSSTADDPVAGNNTSTLTTVQNRTPVASNVTNAPAILRTTTSQTTLASFNASDPDATAGNTTLISYTILSLPTAAQGTLYVNGVAATLNQVITVPTSATAAAPGYQLSFVPNNTFAGNASFTYRATDDTNTASNTATYTVPVTAGADVVATVSGPGTGVEGQSRTYAVSIVNNGPEAATNVVPTLTLSNKPPFSSVTVPAGGNYDPTTGIVTFGAIASLANGASVVSTLNLVLQPTPASFSVTAAGTSATADPVPANNNGTAAAAIRTVTVSRIGAAGIASACATPASSGSATLTANPNTYFPATNQTVAVGATSLVVDAAVGATPVATGDLLLIIQMQGADIDATNTDAYGDGVTGGLATSNLNNANFTAGLYEYVVAAGALSLSGGTLTITTGLKNGYQNASATGTTGQRRFQVVRIPQYLNLTVSGTVAPSAWDGRTGGILALDVTGQLTFDSGAKLDASGKGFRGGAGQKLSGTTGLTGTDYRATAPASGTTTTGAHAMKGEGIVGTPRYVNTGTALFDTGTDGYPNGSAGRGGPGNGGGGGTDANPTTNDQNAGGGGGANGARGGRGGNSSGSNAAVGGEFGAGFSAPSTSRLIMGGGGGAGVTNDGTGGGPSLGYASSGAAGGGIVLLRAGSVAGFTGTILANGGAASNAVLQDGSGGGGAGGSVLITVNNTATLSRLNLAANGGTGGTNTGAGATFGPGGGGGGGIVLTNAAVGSASVAGGTNGTTAGGVAYGAGTGLPGIANSQISNSIANSTAGINCSPDVTAVIAGPASATNAQTVSLSAVFANNGGVDAMGVTRTITLASGDVNNPVTAVSAPGSSSISAPAAGTGTVTITYPAISPLVAGASSSFGVSYTAPGTTAVTATANVTTTSSEPVTDNNTSSAVTTISGFADIVSAVFGLSSSITGLPTGSYSVVFANNGPAAAANVTRTVTLPAGATLTTIQLDNILAQGGTYTSGTQVIDFGTLTTLNSRSAAVFQFGYTASTTSGSGNVVSNTTTTTPQDASNGTGVAADMFSFAVTNIASTDVATNGITTSAASVATGQQASFTLNFINYGPADLSGALRSAQLTPGLSIVSISGGGVYNASSGLVTYPAVALANGASAPSTITFLAPASGPVNLSGSISGGAGAVSVGNFGNNQATASIAVSPLADVATTISGPTTVITGNLATVSATTANNGPSVAAAVVQTIQLPTGLTKVFPSNNGQYDAVTGVVTYPALAVLATGAAVHNTVSFPMPGASFTASAAVTTTTAEAGGTMANNAATAATTQPTAPDATLANVYTTLALTDKNAAPGAPITLTLETGNRGPQPALNVVQQLALPVGLTLVSISNGGTYNSATGLVTFPAIASLTSGTSVPNTVVLTAPAAGPVVAIASVLAATPDPVPADNLVVRNIDILRITDLATTIVGPATASATQVVTFTVTTRNNGPVPAINVIQFVSIPPGFAAGEVLASGGGFYDPASGAVIWPTVASLAVGEVRTYTYSYVAPSLSSTDANMPRTILSQAAVTSSTPDGNTVNSSSTIGTDIQWNTDVAVAVSGPTTAIVGNTITFTVSTSNNGPAPAAGVITNVRIATGLTSVVASGGGVYNVSTGLVTFPAIPTLEVGLSGAVTNTITIVVPDRPIIGVSAAANNPDNELDLTNNAATIILPVTPRTSTLVDVQTTIAANLSSQQAGQPVSYTVTTTNAGTDAANMRQRVSLPAGLSGVVVLNSDGSTLTGAYDAVIGVVTFPLAASQAPGTVLTYGITLNAPGKGPLLATANVNSNFSDALPANNTQSVSVTIVPIADVATVVSGPPARLPGGLGTYKVRAINNGPSPASSVVLTAQLPTGLTDVAASGGGVYDAATGLVTFPTIATQVVGRAGEVSYTLVFTFPTTATTFTSTVTSGTTENAGTTANNTSSMTTVLTNQIPLANTVSNLLQAPQGNTAGPLTLSSLQGLALDGFIASFTITTLPGAGTGVLFLNGVAVGVGQVINISQAANLTFDPAGTFVGNAGFTYTATGNQGAASTPALYTIAVGQDNAAVYTSTPVKGGANQYQDGDVIANVFDANGGAYNAAAAVTDNGVRTASVNTNSLAPGLELDPATGQVRVLDRTLLVTGTYPVTITTTDANGGVTTQTVNLRIGDFPLPVELTRFEARAVGADAQLSWTTAQELNNKGFRVERSFDGTSFVQLDFVAGAGTTAQPRQYAYADAGVGRQYPGTVYYRLQQVDLSGKATYSPVRTVVFVPEAPGLFPNPASAYTTLNLSSLPLTTYDVTLVDMAGRVVRAYALAGGQAHELEVSSLPGGAYLVIVRSGSLKVVCHLLKQ
ncbi:T9SS type A sorting domain-containing protein [Hymenobacter antarcticus]|uniref:ESPR-type extended signal peptide-containing protein n=1 Tax=Hymenobacter antarcticus TaxID=486270 RepID=A0ABP7R1E4_9BACT